MRFIPLLAFACACNGATTSTPTTPPDVDAAPSGTFTPDPGLEGPPFQLTDPACAATGDRITCTAVVYSQVDGTELHLDLQAPLAARTQKVPVIVYLHPGGWSVGPYGQTSQLDTQKYLGEGYAIAAVEYRLTLTPQRTVSGVTFPQDLQDAKTAIRWLRIKAAGFINTDRIVMYGVSAGAHLGSLVATTEAVPEFAGRGDPSVPTTVHAFVGISTPIDFHLFVPMNPALDPSCPSQPPGQDPQQGVSWLIGGALTDPQYDSLLTSMSVLTYMTPAMVPSIFTAGTCDQTVPYPGANEVAAKAQQLGMSQLSVHVVPDAFHGTTLDDPTAKAAVDAFIAAQLDN